MLVSRALWPDFVSRNSIVQFGKVGEMTEDGEGDGDRKVELFQLLRQGAVIETVTFGDEFSVPAW